MLERAYNIEYKVLESCGRRFGGVTGTWSGGRGYRSRYSVQSFKTKYNIKYKVALIKVKVP